jgi:ArsR family transcriptional regulator
MDIDPEIFFKALADPTRLRCLMLLASERELCVCELTHALDEIQPKVSRHLAALRDQGLVLDRRQGQWIYYQLNPELPAWSKAVLRETARGVGEQKRFTQARSKLARMPNRPGASCC